MNLPFLLGYGLAILGVDLVLGTPEPSLNGILLYFIELVVAVSIGEILLRNRGRKVMRIYILGLFQTSFAPDQIHITLYKHGLLL